MQSAARRLRGLAVAACLVSAVALSLPPAQAAGGTDASVAAPSLPIRHAGRWMVDARGRVLLIHGVNMPSKQLPAYPAALGFDDRHAAFLASIGFNAVRLTVERYAVEPAPGRFDDGYVAQIARTVDMLARHGILSMIDFHQDEYGPAFFDNGFPTWMTVTDGLPNLTEVGFPGQYVANPALNRAFDHFWNDDPDTTGSTRLQSDDAAILGHVASALRGDAGVLGYEILNEPWPGTQYPGCFNAPTGCPTFDQQTVGTYYARMTSAIRAADPTHLVWYEPLVTFNYAVPTSVPAPHDPNVGFAFHNYPACSAADDAGLPISPGSSCSAEEQMTTDHALVYVAATGTALLETEFGATKNASTISASVDRYDAAMVPWMFWSYTNNIDKLASNGSLLPPSADNVNASIVDALVRPYPQILSGTPSAYGFDSSTRAFTLRYSTARPDGRGAFPPASETDVAVPARTYPSGYAVTASGADVLSAPGDGILRLCGAAGSADVSVRLAPDSGGGAGGATQGSAASCSNTAAAANLTSVSPGAAVTVSHGGRTVTVAGVGAIRLPNPRACVRRRLAIQLGLRHGVRLIGVRVNGRRVAFRAGNRVNVPVDARAQRAGRVVERIVLRLRRGRSVVTVRLHRSYRLCPSKRRRSVRRRG